MRKAKGLVVLSILTVFLGSMMLVPVPPALAGTGSMSTTECVKAINYAFPQNGSAIFNLNLTNSWNAGYIHVWNASGSGSASYTYLSVVKHYRNESKGDYNVTGKSTTNYTVFADVEGFQTSHRSVSLTRVSLVGSTNGTKTSWLTMNSVSLTLLKYNATSFRATLTAKHLDGYLSKSYSASSSDPLRIIEGVHFVFDNFKATFTFNCATGGYSYSVSASSSPVSAGMMAVQAFLKELHS